MCFWCALKFRNLCLMLKSPKLLLRHTRRHRVCGWGSFLPTERSVYIDNGILFSHKKEWNNTICSNMDGTRDSHPEWSKSERERQIAYDITYMWYLIYSTKEAFQRKENHGLGEQTYGCWERGGESRMDGVLGINRCRLLPLEWISNEILLCSTRNYVWSLMM